MRDFLLTHPDAARRYGALKRRRAATVDDPLVYTRAKTDLIQELVAQARTERRLPLVNIWPDQFSWNGLRAETFWPDRAAEPNGLRRFGICAAMLGE